MNMKELEALWKEKQAEIDGIEAQIDALSDKSMEAQRRFAAEHAPVKPGEIIEAREGGKVVNCTVLSVTAERSIVSEFTGVDLPAWRLSLRVLTKDLATNTRYSGPIYKTMQPNREGTGYLSLTATGRGRE